MNVLAHPVMCVVGGLFSCRKAFQVLCIQQKGRADSTECHIMTVNPMTRGVSLFKNLRFININKKEKVKSPSPPT